MKKSDSRKTILRSLNSLLVLVIISIQFGNAQSFRPNKLWNLIQEKKQTESFREVSLFSPIPYPRLNQFVKNGSAFTLNDSKLQDLMNAGTNSITLVIPGGQGKQLELEMTRADIFSAGFKLGTKGTFSNDNVAYTPGLYYRGIIKGDPNSIASISFFTNDIMGIISDANGNYNLGQMRDEAGIYVLYNDKDVLQPPVIDCSTPYTAPDAAKGGNPSLTAVNCKVVQCYYECDFAMYQAFSSNTTTTANYLTGAFNNEATIYLNDGVTIAISQIFVWTSTDPQASFTSTSSVNNSFSSQTGGTFNGDMAQFLTTRNLGGGIAQGFNGLCNKTQAHSSAQIDVTYSNFPIYSWTVMVMTHEMGHLLGSRHTHACVWNGNNTAIDGCAGGVEGTCALPGNPVGGGTIMSYCHLQSVGINFNLGFGPQPAALILGNVNAAACLFGSSAGTPNGLTTINIGSNAATLNWNAVSGATQYTVEYKITSAGSYTSLGNFTGTTANLTGLAPSTPYTWRVQADCSPFASTNFNTIANSGCGVPVNLTTTLIKSTTAKLNWGAYAGATSYKVKYKVYGTSTFKYLTASNAYKNLSLLAPATKYVWAVKSTCSGGSSTAYSSNKTFTTQSLVAPTNYCGTNGSDASLENITNVTFGSINNTTGSNNGYADFTAQSATLTVGTSHSLSVSVFRSTPTDVEYVNVWIDFNRDGDFTDAGESVYSSNGTQVIFSGTINIPSSANIGSARMRVTVHYGSALVPCGTYDYGETEDYLVTFIAVPAVNNNFRLTSTSEATGLDFAIYPNPASSQVQLQINSLESNEFELTVVTLTGQEVKKVKLAGEHAAFDVSDLKSGFYLFRLCDTDNHVIIKKFIRN